MLRDEGQPVSSAHVIEAVRLAETLARAGRPITDVAQIIHGANDPRVPIGEAEQMVERLRKLGAGPR